MAFKLPHIGKIRFSVGTEAGSRSEFWYINIEKSGDVYVSTSALAGQAKLSLHRDRMCQYGLTELSAADHRSDPTITEPHYHFRWKRPESTTGKPRQIASIVFPALSQDRPMLTNPVDNKSRVMITPAQPGHAIEVGIFYTLLPPDGLMEKATNVGYVPLVYNICKTKEIIFALGHEVPWGVTSFAASSDTRGAVQK